MNNKTIHKNLGHKRAWLLCALGALLMMAGCTNDEFMQQQPQKPSGEGIPFTATISGKAATRAITENTTDKVLVTSWAANEQVALIHNGVVDVMTVSTIGDDGTATITGTITGSPKDGDEVQVVYPASAVDTKTKKVKADLLAEQDGTLATIASELDLRTASGAKLKVGPASATINGAVSLANQIAIVKFSLSDGTEAVAADKFKIRDNSGQTITTVTPAASEFYVAMEPVSDKTFRFNAEGNNMVYSYFKTGATLAAGTYYQSPISMENNSIVPLTLEATENGTKITVINKTQAEQAGDIDYITINVYGNVVENDYINPGDTRQITIAAGEKVTFFGHSQRYGHHPDEIGQPSHITCDKDCYIYGNIMSLINSTGYATKKYLTEDYAFEMLFSNARIKNHPSKALLLPATTLTDVCYSGLFQNTGLTAVPDLPATTLANSCYDGMFQGCTELTTLPEDFLPVTTLVQDCYRCMFQGCTGLTTAPVLPATTLADECYTKMFNGCTKLNSVTCLATDLPDGVSANSCLRDWLDGAGTAEGCERKLYVDPATTLTDDDWKLATSGEDGKRWTTSTSNYMAKSCAISELTTKEIGWRLGSDGVAYEPGGILPDGVKARAVIAYVGKVDKYFDHFLAIALEDVDNSSLEWAEVLTKVGTYAENHSIKIGNTTYNENTTPSTFYDKVANNTGTSSATRSTTTLTLKQGWRLPSVTDWRYIFEGLGRIKGGLTLTAKKGDTTYSSDARPTNPHGIENGMYYSNSLLRNAINAACGNTALRDQNYWSSSEFTENSNEMWHYEFSASEFLREIDNKTRNNFLVRAVFAY